MKFDLLNVLLFINFFDAIVSCLNEQVGKEAVKNEMKNVVLVKRQLSDIADEDTSEVFGSISDRDLIYNMFKPVKLAKVTVATTGTTVSTTTTTTIEAQLSTVNETDDPRNCTCRPENSSSSDNYNQSNTRSSRDDDSNIYMVEKQYDEEKHFNKKIEHMEQKLDKEAIEEEDVQEETSTVRNRSIKTTLRPMPTNSHKNNYKAVLGQPSRQDVEYVMKNIEDQIETAIRQLCHYYQEVPDLDVHRMEDVWQLSYYKADEPLSCFKIFIKKSSPQARRRYEAKYSSFNDTVNWQECVLELVSTGRFRDDRKHFLQATKSDKGILDNIIISDVDENENRVITLQEQTPDQWLVTHNLLLMRDCGSGDVVIFTRVPSRSTWDEVERAMIQFGEKGINGTKPCHVIKDISSEEVFKYKKYHILS